MSLDFSGALELLKEGKRLTRLGWDGKGQFIFLVPGSRFNVAAGRPMAHVFPIGAELKYRPHIDIYTVQGSVVPWIASQSDLLADDWEVVTA